MAVNDSSLIPTPLRPEIERLTAEGAMWLGRAVEHLRERDEALAEVERLRRDVERLRDIGAIVDRELNLRDAKILRLQDEIDGLQRLVDSMAAYTIERERELIRVKDIDLDDARDEIDILRTLLADRPTGEVS